MIAEDEPTSQKILLSALEKWGYDVVCTGNGSDALEVLAREDSPQLALIDWMMPGLEGPVLCRELRRMNKEKPLYIIFLTQRDSPNDIIAGFEAGADDYILKPFRREELRVRINVGRRFILMQNELMQQHKLRGALEMAGTICHEINQPLQIISGFTELLLTEFRGDEAKAEVLEIIKEATARIGMMTKTVMSLSSYRSATYIGGENSIIDIERCK